MNTPITAGDAAWVWLDAPDAHAPNTFVAFRRQFAVSGALDGPATVAVTADARYELFVNGTWVGHGPARSFPSLWPVDTYDVSHLLTAEGPNVVAVLVQYYGVGTFQYIEAEPGLLAEIHWSDGAGAHTVGTGESGDGWRCRRHEGFAPIVPRISCQQGWEEQFDARRAPGLDWTVAAFDDTAWSAPMVTHRMGEGPHPALEARDIPFLTREPAYPARIRSIDVVRPADYTWSMNPRTLLNATDLSANFLIGRMMLVTYIDSPAEQAVQLHLPQTGPGEWKLNGTKLAFSDHAKQWTDGGVAHARLRAGTNVLLVKMPESKHVWNAVVNLWTEQPVTFSGKPGGAESPWSCLGPFAGAPNPTEGQLVRLPHYILAEHIEPGATDAAWHAVWERGEPTAEELAAPWVRPLPPETVNPADIYALCASERVVPDATPARIEEAQAVAEDTGDWATIYPSPDGDVRLLLDYGRELVGFHAFEIDAPAGTVVDLHDFEFIQRDGRVNLCEGMNNSLRCVCREGYQTYRSWTRHGLRYGTITLRNFDRPIRLRNVHVLFSTYPVAQEGDFDCADPLLTRIWEVGAHSVRCCAEDTYTDCPTYEQVHWVGDARNEALVDLVANGDPRLSAHCWTQVARSLDRSPIVEAQVPSSWYTLLPAWSFLWMRWAHEHYVLTGDADFARTALPYLQRNIDGIRAHLNKDGLFHIHAWNMFDWAPMDTPANALCVTHQFCLAVQGVRQAAELARLLNETETATAWESFADEMSATINAQLWSDEKQAYLDCLRFDGSPSPIFSQQTQTAAFISGVAKDGGRDARCRAIIELAPPGFVAAGSPFFMFFVLETLAREGQWDLLVQTIRDYWGIQISAGATSFWEMYYPDRERHTRSHCHGWSAAPTFFLSQYVLGVQPYTPGYETVLVRPPLLPNLPWAHGHVPTPHGTIECGWRRGDDGAFTVRVVAPEGVGVRIELPVAGTVSLHGGEAKRVAAYAESGGAVYMAEGGRPVVLTVEGAD